MPPHHQVFGLSSWVDVMPQFKLKKRSEGGCLEDSTCITLTQSELLDLQVELTHRSGI